jgi:hypothetical protein
MAHETGSSMQSRGRSRVSSDPRVSPEMCPVGCGLTGVASPTENNRHFVTWIPIKSLVFDISERKSFMIDDDSGGGGGGAKLGKRTKETLGTNPLNASVHFRQNHKPRGGGARSLC